LGFSVFRGLVSKQDYAMYSVNLKLSKVVIIFFAITTTMLALWPIANYLRGSTKDYATYFAVGQSVIRGGDIYWDRGDGTFQFMYPPPAATLFAIPSYFGELPLIILLVLLYSIAWIASALLCVYLVTGTLTPATPLLYLLPAFCCLPYAAENFALGQPNLFLLALMLGAFAFLRRQKAWTAGALIALATVIKAFPALAIGYLVYRRYWKATISTLAFLILFLIAFPAPFRGFDRNLQDLKTWTEGMTRYEAGSISQRAQRGFSWANHSLVAVAHRLLRPVNAHRKKDETLFVNVADLDFRQVTAVILIAAGGLCLLYIICMPTQHNRTDRSDALEHAILLLLILIFTPLAFTYFFVWLFYPLVMALHLVLTAPPASSASLRRWTWFWVSLVPLTFTIPFSAFRPLQAAGSTLVTCLLLIGGLGWHLREEGRRRSLAPARTNQHGIDG
jgi:hypothetical protein